MNEDRAQVEKYEKVAPHVWSMYQQLMEGRVFSHENRLNFFLAVDALFLVGYMSLFEEQLRSYSFWFIVPFLLLLFPAIALLTDFYTRSIDIPWFDERTLKITVERDRFYLNWLIRIYLIAYQTWEFQNRAVRLLAWCYWSVISSLAWLLALFLRDLCRNDISTTEFMIILGLVIVGIVMVVILACSNQKGYENEKWKSQITNVFVGGEGKEGTDH